MTDGGVDIIVCDRGRAPRNKWHCGFPAGSSVCGVPVDAGSLDNIRPGLSYCGAHFARAMAAKAAAKRGTSGR